LVDGTGTVLQTPANVDAFTLPERKYVDEAAINYRRTVDGFPLRTQTCQVTLILRVRPTFWPVNQHSLAENLN